MIESIRYVTFKDNDDKVYGLGRIISDETGLWGEVFHDGQWVKDKVALDALFDPGFADIINYEEAKSIAKNLRMSIDEEKLSGDY